MKSWMEISAAALAANVCTVRASASRDAGVPVEVLAVVKADGYGHGAEVMAQALASAGVTWLGVTDAEEGVAVRKVAGPQLRILVMCGTEPQDAAAIVAHDLTPVIWTEAHIAALDAAALAAGRSVRIHLEIDTGMARQGVPAGPELAGVLLRLAQANGVVCEGVLSHLACAEVAHSPVTAAQRERFAAALDQVRAAGVQLMYVHLANTSAVDEASTASWVAEAARLLDAQPMVRTGIAVYGYALAVEYGQGELQPALVPAMTWKTRVIGLRDVAAGATVGYGATFVAPTPMRLALLPVGYADGFRREASSGLGNGWVMVRGSRAAVVGRVSMNLTVVNVTGIEQIAVGDDVELLGQGVSAQDHAHWCRTIPYDILCGIRAHARLVD